MKVALVHDYLGEFGGAERVLEALAEIWPKAPIYTAFYREGAAYNRFKNRKIITSWVQRVPFFAIYLHSPLRFLAPWVWGSFDFSSYDVVITSASWYVTKGVVRQSGNQDIRASGKKQKNPDYLTTRKPDHPIEICYCHTPPRYLYGYPTSVNFQRYWPVKVYALFVNHFMRVYDFEAAQRVDYFIANSKEVSSRIKKFYRRESKVIYPPVDTSAFSDSKRIAYRKNNKLNANSLDAKRYFLVVSRLVASKNVELAIKVCGDMGLPLKVVGTGREFDNLKKLIKDIQKIDDRRKSVYLLGDVSDEELVDLYKSCRAVIFPASQEDFGLVPVEAMAAGKPVIALGEGGVLETVIDGKTGIYFDRAKTESLGLAIGKFMELEKKGVFNASNIKKHAKKFSKDRFKREILKFVESKVK